MGVFNITIIPLALVGYKMIIANSYPTRTRGIIVNYENMLALFTVLRTVPKNIARTAKIQLNGWHLLIEESMLDLKSLQILNLPRKQPNEDRN